MLLHMAALNLRLESYGLPPIAFPAFSESSRFFSFASGFPCGGSCALSAGRLSPTTDAPTDGRRRSSFSPSLPSSPVARSRQGEESAAYTRSVQRRLPLQPSQFKLPEQDGSLHFTWAKANIHRRCRPAHLSPESNNMVKQCQRHRRRRELTIFVAPCP